MSELTQEQKEEAQAKVNEKKLKNMQAHKPTIVESEKVTEDTVFVEHPLIDQEYSAVVEYSTIEENDDNTSKEMSIFVDVSTIEGFKIDPTMSEDDIEILYENISSYIGVIPKDIGQYINHWLECYGCVVQPIENKYINELSGEEINDSWVKPLFKVKDPEDGKIIIVSGGGKNGLQFARNMNNVFKIGDFNRPKLIQVSQENRTSANKQTGEKEPHRLYRFNFKHMPKGDNK